MRLFLGFRIITLRSDFTAGQVSSTGAPDYRPPEGPTRQAVKNIKLCHGFRPADNGH
jgi:hypothetical protein